MAVIGFATGPSRYCGRFFNVIQPSAASNTVCSKLTPSNLYILHLFFVKTALTKCYFYNKVETTKKNNFETYFWCATYWLISVIFKLLLKLNTITTQ